MPHAADRRPELEPTQPTELGLASQKLAERMWLRCQTIIGQDTSTPEQDRLLAAVPPEIPPGSHEIGVLVLRVNLHSQTLKFSPRNVEPCIVEEGLGNWAQRVDTLSAINIGAFTLSYGQEQARARFGPEALTIRTPSLTLARNGTWRVVNSEDFNRNPTNIAAFLEEASQFLSHGVVEEVT